MYGPRHVFLFSIGDNVRNCVILHRWFATFKKSVLGERLLYKIDKSFYNNIESYVLNFNLKKLMKFSIWDFKSRD